MKNEKNQKIAVSSLGSCPIIQFPWALSQLDNVQMCDKEQADMFTLPITYNIQRLYLPYDSGVHDSVVEG